MTISGGFEPGVEAAGRCFREKKNHTKPIRAMTARGTQTPMAILDPRAKSVVLLTGSGVVGAVGEEGVFAAPPGLAGVGDELIVTRVELPIAVLPVVGLAVDLCQFP